MAQTIIANILSPVIVALVGYIVWLLQTTRTEQRDARKKAAEDAEKATKQLDAISGGVCFLLRGQLDRFHDKFVVKGDPMSTEDFDAVETCYRHYAALGGNGTGEKEYDDLRDLDITR